MHSDKIILPQNSTRKSSAIFRPYLADGSQILRTRTNFEIPVGNFRRHGRREFPERLAVFDGHVQIFRRVRILRRSKGTAIAEGPRPEFCPALHPGNYLE